MNELETRSDDEISLLDLLLIIAQNWLLLIVVPAIFGAIAFAVVFAQPQTYRSEATIGLPVQIVEALIASLEDEGTIDPRLTPTATGADGLMVAQGSDAQSSLLVVRHRDATAGAALENLLISLESRAEDMRLPNSHSDLFNRIRALRTGQAFRDGMIARLEDALVGISASVPFDAQAYALAALALDQILTSWTAAGLELDTLEFELATVGVQKITVSPIAGPMRDGRSPLMMAALAALGSGFLLLVFVFMRAGLRGASKDAETREKIEKIKDAIFLRRPTGK
jgi:hypothetical protein